MIVPEFWAEAKKTGKINGRTITIKRFGWSDTDQQSAQLLADERVELALADLRAGKKINPREIKRAYNGADGVPIREEIISREGDAVITRNAYGARCLNVPDVLFGDIDVETGLSIKFHLSIFFTLLVTALVIIFFRNGHLSSLLLLALTPIICFIVNKIRSLFSLSEKNALTKIENFAKKNPAWNLQIYKTPMGFRILVLHKTFQARSEEVTDFFNALGVDRLYQRMCFNQNCFRARISAKPWRIGIKEHLRPRPGIWPVSADKLPVREAWVNAYEETAKDFAACRFLHQSGSTDVDPKAQIIKQLHDHHCRADTQLPLA
ncbi:MAG: hypothetical protein B0W54_15110 [Cellvibrio sp. 79]|nr:MAG: hypothetical protein B0W54_15110 [Cellvibrio sp. 79]